MRFLERLFASRAARIGIVLVWLVFGGLGGSFAQRFQDIQKNEDGTTVLPTFRPGRAKRAERESSATGWVPPAPKRAFGARSDRRPQSC